MKKTAYRQLADEELVTLSRNGDTDATEFIMDKYKDLVRNKARSMFLIGGDGEDLIQEGMIGLFKAIRDYDPDRDAAFSTFAVLCISRQMYTAVQSYSRRKHTPLNTAISLDREITGDGNGGNPAGREEQTLISMIQDAQVLDPESELIDRENVSRLLDSVDRILSPLEKQVFELTIAGIGYTEIAKILGKENRSIDNAQQRMRKKLRSLLEKENDR